MTAKPGKGPLSSHPLMKPLEAARYLGLSRSSFHRRVIDKRLIPYLIDKASKRRCYRREDLDAYANSHYELCPAIGLPQRIEVHTGQTERSAKRHAAKARA